MKGTQDVGSFSACVWQPDKHEIIHLQSTAVERRIYKLLQGKQDVQKKFLKMFADSNEVW